MFGANIASTLTTRAFSTSSVNFLTYSVAGFKTIWSGVEHCSIIPSFIIAIRSANLRASSKSCVIKTIVFPRIPCNLRNSSCISRLISGSSAENGSSKNQISGSMAKLLAIPTRCCCPPDNSLGKYSSLPSSPTNLTTSMARSRRVYLSWPRISSGNATFSKTVLCGSRPKDWKTIPIFERRNSISSFSVKDIIFCPSTKISPPVISCNRERHRTKVDFPDPESPIMTSISPLWTSSETSFTPAM